MLRDINVSNNHTTWIRITHGFEFTNGTTSFATSSRGRFADLISSSGYIGEFEIIDDHRAGKIVVQLNGRLNKTGVISPRFNVQVPQIESWVNLLLPARGFGIIILVRLIHNTRRGLPLTLPTDHLIWNPRSRRGPSQERRRQALGLRLLIARYCTSTMGMN